MSRTCVTQLAPGCRLVVLALLPLLSCKAEPPPRPPPTAATAVPEVKSEPAEPQGAVAAASSPGPSAGDTPATKKDSTPGKRVEPRKESLQTKTGAWLNNDEQPTEAPGAPNIDIATFSKLFLGQADFGADDIKSCEGDPGTINLQQDVRAGVPVEQVNDALLRSNKGQRWGRAQWMGRSDSALYQMFDIRTLFADAASAKEYLAAARSGLSEGLPRVAGAKSVGNESSVHCGSLSGMPVCTVVFRMQNVVAKLYFSGGECEGNVAGRVSDSLAVRYARKAARRISSASR